MYSSCIDTQQSQSTMTTNSTIYSYTITVSYKRRILVNKWQDNTTENMLN